MSGIYIVRVNSKKKADKILDLARKERRGCCYDECWDFDDSRFNCIKKIYYITYKARS